MSDHIQVSGFSTGTLTLWHEKRRESMLLNSLMVDINLIPDGTLDISSKLLQRYKTEPKICYVTS